MTLTKRALHVMLIRLNSQLLNTSVVLVKRGPNPNWQPSEYFRAWHTSVFLENLY